jgi:hypothetical protein
MSPTWKRALGILLLILTLVVVALMATAWALLPLDRTAITIDGDTFSLADLTGGHAIIFFVVAVAVVVFALVLAITAGALGLGLGVIGLAFGLVVTLGTLALVAAPFAFVVWLVWRLVRTASAPAPARS